MSAPGLPGHPLAALLGVDAIVGLITGRDGADGVWTERKAVLEVYGLELVQRLLSLGAKRRRTVVMGGQTIVHALLSLRHLEVVAEAVRESTKDESAALELSGETACLTIEEKP